MKSANAKDRNIEQEENKMAFDYKKEYKEFYMPKKKPGIVEVDRKSVV